MIRHRLRIQTSAILMGYRASARPYHVFENFRIHDLRHTCAAWLVSAGVPLSEVRDLLGHSTVMVTERYAHLAPENVRAAVTQLENIQSHFGHTKVVCEVDVPAKSLI